MSISFEDFLLYTKAPESDIKLFPVISLGVLEYIKDTYGIFIEEATIDYKYFMLSAGTTLTLPVSPLNNINSIKVNGVDQVFTYYGEDIELSTAITDLRIPLICNIDVGYTTIPADLKLAIYQHIESVYFSTKNSADNIEKIINTSGNTTYLKDESLPKFSKSIYNKYSNRLIAYY